MIKIIFWTTLTVIVASLAISFTLIGSNRAGSFSAAGQGEPGICAVNEVGGITTSKASDINACCSNPRAELFCPQDSNLFDPRCQVCAPIPSDLNIN